MRTRTLILITTFVALAGSSLVRNVASRRLDAIRIAGTSTMDAGSLCGVHLFDGVAAQQREALQRRDPEQLRRILEHNLQLNIATHEYTRAYLLDQCGLGAPRTEAGLHAQIAGEDATLDGLRKSMARLREL